MKFIKVTSLDGEPIFINPQHIGHMYEIKERVDYGSVTKPRHTRIGVVTHNNGGFEAKESPQEIMDKINS